LEHDHAYLESVWTQYNFSPSLDQSLILAMKDETRWIIENDLTPEKQDPNFLDSISINGLAKIKPDAVNIIR